MLEDQPMADARDPVNTACSERAAVDEVGPVVVTGSSGLIGAAVCQALRRSGQEVRRLVRREPGRDDEYRWDPEADFIDVTAFSGARSVVHLAGAPVATRWTKTMKDRIYRSRIEGTHQIHSAASRVQSVQTLVCASAIGFYGFDPARPAADESTGSGDGFLAEVCQAWEHTARTAISDRSDVRLTIARIGVVLDQDGGMLAHLLSIARRLRRVPLVGSGDQWISWVSLPDCIDAIRLCLTERMSGPVNIVSPNVVTQRELATLLSKRIAIKTAPIPAPMIRCIAGRLGEEVLLGGRRASALRLQRAGYTFTDPELSSVMRRLNLTETA